MPRRAPNPSESSLTPGELQSLMQQAVKAGVEMANKFASSSKAQDQLTKRDIEFANPGIEIQFRIAEETLFYLNKAVEKMESNESDSALPFIQRAKDLQLNRKKELQIADQSGWGVVAELKRFDNSDFSKEEKQKWAEAETRFEARQKKFRGSGAAAQEGQTAKNASSSGRSPPAWATNAA